MSTITEIRGVPILFPFQPYEIQKDYMEKVIECLQTESVAVLESPTGTGKTLSLLCSSLAWLQLKKAQLEAQSQTTTSTPLDERTSHLEELKSENSSSELEEEEKANEMATNRSAPTIIYASRTHAQLSQAMQELKRSAYSYMSAIVLGSKHRLCIHPEVKAEKEKALKDHLCKLIRGSKSCNYKNRVGKMKKSPEICNTPIIDIEDMIRLGTQHTFCPFYMTRKLIKKADIIFAPYPYLLDPVTSKALVLNLNNCVIIFDEGHNIEKVCEEAASGEVTTTDLLLAISELDVVITHFSEAAKFFAKKADNDEADEDKIINPDRLANFKRMLLRLIDIIHQIPLNTMTDDVTSFPGDYIFEILGKANITKTHKGLIDKMIQFLAIQSKGRFGKNGKGLKLFGEFLIKVFVSNATNEKVRHCFKVHVKQEETPTIGKRRFAKRWRYSQNSSATVRVLSFWCFCPGFGMNLITKHKIKGLILTSGTLAPLKPLITELELNVKIRLENPHVVTHNQICVKVLCAGPDGERLNSSYQNRDNPNYVSSLGRAIVNLSRIIPDGLLIFFPSYPIMLKCQDAWQAEGIWANIESQKAIFVEPRDKDAFTEAMTGYYEKIKDPNLKGAVFMAVCRGKVSEGLDFVDANGRAVILTGLPYPPLRDAKVILKRRYLDECHDRDKEFLTGSDWYSLEATRAVNQAIGRVIRHRYDYGAILLLDERFSRFQIIEQMSKWLRDHVKVVNKYGEVIRDLSQFYRKAQSELPIPEIKLPFNPPKTTSDEDSANNDNSINCDETKYLGTTDNTNDTVEIHSFINRETSVSLVNPRKRKKICLISKNLISKETAQVGKHTSIAEYCAMMKEKLGDNFEYFAKALRVYSTKQDLDDFLKTVDPLVPQQMRYVFVGLYKYIRPAHSARYMEFLTRNNLSLGTTDNPNGTVEIYSSSKRDSPVPLLNPGKGENVCLVSNNRISDTVDVGTTDNPNGTVDIHSFSKRDRPVPLFTHGKRKNINSVSNNKISEETVDIGKHTSIAEYCVMMKERLGDNFEYFAKALRVYSTKHDLDDFLKTVDPLVPQQMRYVFVGLYKYIRPAHSARYMEFLTRNNLSLGTTDNPNDTVDIHSFSKRERPLFTHGKRKNINSASNNRISEETVDVGKHTSIGEYCAMMKERLGDDFQYFAKALRVYSTTHDLDDFLKTVDPLVPQQMRYVFVGLYKYIKPTHSAQYREFLARNNLALPDG